MIKAVIFDFDGVIIDTEKQKFKALQQAAQQQGITIPKTAFHSMIGKKRSYFIKETVKDINEEQIAAIMDTIYNQETNPEAYETIPGIKPLLDHLKQQGKTLAITTGSKKAFVQALLKGKRLDTYFDKLITGELFTTSKPDPECYQKTLEALKQPAQACLAIEDSIAGITAAKTLGITTYALATYHDKKDLRQADKQFKDHNELLRSIKNTPL